MEKSARWQQKKTPRISFIGKYIYSAHTDTVYLLCIRAILKSAAYRHVTRGCVCVCLLNTAWLPTYTLADKYTYVRSFDFT